MIKKMRRVQKFIATAMLLLNCSGARVHASCDACERERVFFGPSLSFKAIARTVNAWATGDKWERKPPRALGSKENHGHSQDLEWTSRKHRAAPATATTPLPAKLEPTKTTRLRQYAWVIASDTSPTQPPHLHSKK